MHVCVCEGMCVCARVCEEEGGACVYVRLWVYVCVCLRHKEFVYICVIFPTDSLYTCRYCDYITACHNHPPFGSLSCDRWALVIYVPQGPEMTISKTPNLCRYHKL